MNHKMSEFDFVFLSFDEPNAEILYSELVDLVPWAKRVHGVKGFDAAHRRCAAVSDTDFFVTVDGDNSIYPEFLDIEININDDQHDHAWTWAGRNHINGLVYGNGGLKLWSKSFVMGMNSHENAKDPASRVDFCWSPGYHEMQGCYSTSMVNGSPEQAWRSGFREGVKMSLDRGMKVDPREFHDRIWFGNVNRLCIWSRVGMDVDNGIWAIYGARMGCHLSTMLDDDHGIISDYDKMHDLWEKIKNDDPLECSRTLGLTLTPQLGLDLSLLSPDDSRFFKRVYMNPPRPWMGSDQIKHFMAIKHV